MEKRSFVAFVLAMAVLAFYPKVVQKFYPEAFKNRQHASATLSRAGASSPKLIDSSSPAGGFDASADVKFTTPKLSLAFNKKAGAIREVEFLDFKDDKGVPIRFFSLDSSGGSPTAIDVVDAGGLDATYDVREEAGGVVATGQPTPSIKVTKRMTFRDDGLSADLGVTFENVTDAPVVLRYRMAVGSRIPARQPIDGQYIEANFYSTAANGKHALRHIKEHKAGKNMESGSPVDWVAVKDRHFSLILKPLSPVGFTGLVQGLGNRQFAASLVSEPVTIPAHASVKHDFLFYAGPNEIERLIPLGLDPIVNFGKLDMIGRLLVGVLELLRGVFHNYGAAIIVLTLSINLLLFPFTRVSYMSMKRMQLIQPQMNKVREQHKNNPDKMNREMMELYKKHKVNPFGGCLPMLIQMPVFIALYVALSKTVGLRNASFLWIRDLSSPDSVYLPFGLPVLGHEVHVLPLIMVVAMALQQRFTQIKVEGQDPNVEAQQKMMAFTMPILFGFIFYGMPAGLVLYWLTNTLLMSSYQFHLKKITLT